MKWAVCLGALAMFPGCFIDAAWLDYCGQHACDGGGSAADSGIDAGAAYDAGLDGGADAGFDAGLTDAGPTDAGPGDGGPNLIFVTSGTYKPAVIGGLAGGDALCAAAAAAGSRPGHFIAWLATSTSNAADRLGQARGWIRADGRPFVDQVSDLRAGRTMYPVRFDELGRDVGSVQVATGANTDGTPEPGYTCGDWTDAGQPVTQIWLGGSAGGGPGWTSLQRSFCDGAYHLFCLQTDNQVPVSVSMPDGGRLVFVSSPWSIAVDAGFAAADAHCAQDAVARWPSRTFRAYLSGGATQAASRVGAGVWYRPDGVEVGNLMGTNLFAAPDQSIDGSYGDGNKNPFVIWTGATDPIASPMASCSAWTDPDAGQPISGLAAYSDSYFFSNPLTNSYCASAGRIYCAEL